MGHIRSVEGPNGTKDRPPPSKRKFCQQNSVQTFRLQLQCWLSPFQDSSFIALGVRCNTDSCLDQQPLDLNCSISFSSGLQMTSPPCRFYTWVNSLKQSLCIYLFVLFFSRALNIQSTTNSFNHPSPEKPWFLWPQYLWWILLPLSGSAFHFLFLMYLSSYCYSSLKIQLRCHNVGKFIWLLHLTPLSREIIYHAAS